MQNNNMSVINIGSTGRCQHGEVKNTNLAWVRPVHVSITTTKQRCITRAVFSSICLWLTAYGYKWLTSTVSLHSCSRRVRTSYSYRRTYMAVLLMYRIFFRNDIAVNSRTRKCWTNMCLPPSSNAVCFFIYFCGLLAWWLKRGTATSISEEFIMFHTLCTYYVVLIYLALYIVGLPLVQINPFQYIYILYYILYIFTSLYIYFIDKATIHSTCTSRNSQRSVYPSVSMVSMICWKINSGTKDNPQVIVRNE